MIRTNNNRLLIINISKWGNLTRGPFCLNKGREYNFLSTFVPGNRQILKIRNNQNFCFNKEDFS